MNSATPMIWLFLEIVLPGSIIQQLSDFGPFFIPSYSVLHFTQTFALSGDLRKRNQQWLSEKKTN